MAKQQLKPIRASMKAEDIFKYVKEQFIRPEDCYRELIQNAKDSDSPRIAITFTYKTKNEEELKKAIEECKKKQEYFKELPYNQYKEREEKLCEEKISGLEGTLLIQTEDFGTGMDDNDRTEFFNRLFASSKEGNTKKTGRFGVGLISVFSLGLDEFIAESCKNGIGWKQHIWSIKEWERGNLTELKHLVHSITERKGTRISLVKYCSRGKAVELREKAFEAIMNDCCYIKQALVFKHCEDSDSYKEIHLNKAFDLESPIKVKFRRRGIEGVIAFAKDLENPKYDFLNNRLRIKSGSTNELLKISSEEKNSKEEEINLKKFPLDLLISSEFIDYNISRNDVVKNENYFKVLKAVNEEAEKIILQVAQYLAHLARKKAGIEADTDGLPEFLKKLEKNSECKIPEHALWDYLAEKVKDWDFNAKKSFSKFIKSTLSRRSSAFTNVPSQIYNLQIFATATGDVVSMNQLDSYFKEYTKIYDSSTNSSIAKMVSERGGIVLLKNDYAESFFAKTGFMTQIRDVNSSYHVPKICLEQELSEAEKSFLKTLNEGLKNNWVSSVYTKIVFENGELYTNHSPFSSVHPDGLVVKKKKISEHTTTMLKELSKLPGKFARWALVMRDPPTEKGKTLVLNKNHNEINELVNFSKINPKTARELLYATIESRERYFSNLSVKGMLESYLE